jgi:FAD/FMN-containing dehydrogenase
MAATDELAAMPAERRLAELRSMADRVFNASAIGSFLMERDTTAVVDLVLENPDGFRNARLELARAVREARRFLMIIDVAERRLAAGLAEIAGGLAQRA